MTFTRFVPLLIGLVAALPMIARAQDYPSRPIRIVTLFTESAVSNRERFVAVKLGEQLGVNMFIDSKPGGGGIIAMREVYRSQPMGYSLLLSNNSLVGNTFAFKEPGYKIDDYVPIGVLGQSPLGMVMNASIVPAKNLNEFVAWVKANPGKVNFGSLGPSTGSNISAERFKQMAGISMTGVPYKGGDQMALAMLAGDIHVSWLTLISARTRMQSKQIVGVATTGSERSSFLPNVPTFAEMGYPDMDTVTWYALMTPSGMPAPMLGKLRSAFAVASSAPDWKKVMEQNELEPYKGSNEQFMASVRREAAKLGADYQRLGLPQE